MIYFAQLSQNFIVLSLYLNEKKDSTNSVTYIVSVLKDSLLPSFDVVPETLNANLYCGSHGDRSIRPRSVM